MMPATCSRLPASRPGLKPCSCRGPCLIRCKNARMSTRQVVSAVDERDSSLPMSPFDMMEREFQAEQLRMEKLMDDMDSKYTRSMESRESMRKEGMSQNVRIEELRTESSYFYSYSSTTPVGLGYTAKPTQGYGLDGISVAVVVGLATLSYLFQKGYSSTTFRKERKWRLVLLWPVLMFNKSFRNQFKTALKAAVRDIKKGLKDEEDTTGGDEGSVDV